jgi:hypothetical protein
MRLQAIEQYEVAAREYCITMNYDPDELVAAPTNSMVYHQTFRWRVIAAEMIKMQAMLDCLQKHQAPQTEAP